MNIGKFTFCLLIVILSSVNLKAAEYYVAANGNNSNPGTISQPWRTIQHAADVMMPGDIVYIRGGTYNENIQTTRSGTANAYITFSGYQSEVVEIRSTSHHNGNGFIVGHSYIKLNKLRTSNYDTGIWVNGNIGFIEITDCKSYDSNGGISFSDGTHDFLVMGCEMYHCGDVNQIGFGFDATANTGTIYNGAVIDCISRDQLGTDNTDGFALGHDNVSNVKFIGCKTYNVYDGFDLSGRGIVAERCAAWNCFNGGFKLWRDSVKLINCVGYHNATDVELDYYTGGVERPVYALLMNCTFYNAYVLSSIWVEHPSNKLNMYNCIISGSCNYGIIYEQQGLSNYRGDYNIFHSDDSTQTITNGYVVNYSLGDIENGVWTQATGQDLHSRVCRNLNSMYINLDSANVNWHLKNGSVAVDNGTNNGAPEVDYDYCLRIYPPTDIGADEYGECVIGVEKEINKLNEFKLFQNYPNPFNPVTRIKFDIPPSVSHSGSGVKGQPSIVKLTIYDLLGKVIAVLVNEGLRPGSYEVTWNGSNYPSGVYFCRILADGFSESKKVVLLK